MSCLWQHPTLCKSPPPSEEASALHSHGDAIQPQQPAAPAFAEDQARDLHIGTMPCHCDLVLIRPRWEVSHAPGCQGLLATAAQQGIPRSFGGASVMTAGNPAFCPLQERGHCVIHIIAAPRAPNHGLKLRKPVNTKPPLWSPPKPPLR